MIEALALALSPLAETDKDVIRAEIRSMVKDPESARFQWIPHIGNKPDKTLVCGFVNARNGYGGYTGFQPFLARVIRLDGKTFANAAVASVSTPTRNYYPRRWGGSYRARPVEVDDYSKVRDACAEHGIDITGERVED